MGGAFLVPWRAWKSPWLSTLNNGPDRPDAGGELRVSERPIGFFDSGEGGLTVMREVARILPGEDLIYACDTLHFPYGPRPMSEVRSFLLGFMEFFATRNCKLVVVACNTATAAALDLLEGGLLPVRRWASCSLAPGLPRAHHGPAASAWRRHRERVHPASTLPLSGAISRRRLWCRRPAPFS